MWFGIFFFIVGISVLLKSFFHIDVPIFRTLVGVLFLYAGYKAITGGFGFESKEENVSLFEKTEYSATDGKIGDKKDFSNFFSKITVKLKDLPKPETLPLHLEFNTVFGETRVILPKGMRVRIKANAVFGEARVPGDNTVAFGTLVYESPKDPTQSGGSVLDFSIRGNVVFGGLKFIEGEE